MAAVLKPEFVLNSFGGTPEAWDKLIRSLPGPHILQSSAWGQLKSCFGWRPMHYTWEGESGIAAAALVLLRELPLPGIADRPKVIYLPKGPLLNWEDLQLRRQVLEDLEALARSKGAIFIKIDPDVRLGIGIHGESGAEEDPLGDSVTDDLLRLGWRFSEEQIQFRNTILVDLRPDEETILSRMKQKTRYNIRLAQRKGLKIRVADKDDFGLLFHMYAETANRDGFVIRDEAYYLKLWDSFISAGLAEALIAEVSSVPAAALVVFRFAERAWYMNGMSRPVYRDWMPNHLLQWEAMHRAKDAGMTSYDLWGAPDAFNSDDPLWGVFRFKEGFGGEVVRHIGAWDLPIRQVLYKSYIHYLPRLLDLMRRRGRTRTRRMVE